MLEQLKKWLVDCFVIWVIDVWLVNGLVRCLVYWLVGWLADLLTGLMICWLTGWLAGGLTQ